MDLNSPHLSSMCFTKVIEQDMAEVSMDGHMVRLLMVLDARKTIGEIAQETGMVLTEVRQALSRLLALGLIRPVNQPTQMMPEGFIADLNIALARAVGPIGTILIEETTEDLGLTGAQVPKAKAADLVTSLSREIPNAAARTKFQQTMVHFLKSS